MIHYPDTSFLCSIYRAQAHSLEAVRFRSTMGEPVYYTELLEFEFLHSLRFQAWRFSRDYSQGFTSHEADAITANWKTDIATGNNVLVPCNMNEVIRLSKSLALQYTEQYGHRPFDMLHVATALHLDAKKFLTFDNNQRILAQHVGLKTS